MSKNRIGLVDDDAGLCQAVSRLLRVGGFQVEPFPSAEAFLEAHAETRLDCLILDIHLGGLSGFELLEQLVLRGVRLPTIFITAHDSPANRARAAALGANGYLCKPFTNEQIRAAIRRAVLPESPPAGPTRNKMETP